MKRAEKDIRSQKEAIIMTLVGVAKKAKKGYCWPSQACILRLLIKYHKLVISRRTLCRRMKELEVSGWLTRIRRLARGKDGGFIKRSTLYKLCGKVYAWVGRLGRWAVSVARVFDVPKVAHNYSLRERKVLKLLSPSDGSIEVKERDGSISRYHPITGEYPR